VGGISDHVEINRAHWGSEAGDYVAAARRSWATDEMSWGIWGIPEAEVGVVGDVDGLDVIELGCGTAYWSAWLARRGARPVGIDVTPEQLATARAMQAEHGLEFPLIEASAEAVPLPDDGFDLAFSEYGASLWCEPEAWLAEAARLLRPGGRLIFLTNHILVMLTTPADEGPSTRRLERPQFGMRRIAWAEGGVEFHLPHGEMIRVLGEAGFGVESLHELRAPEGVETRYDFVDLEWARSWPSEELWTARLR
jgi:SAM-dependent methyltransferase